VRAALLVVGSSFIVLATFVGCNALVGFGDLEKTNVAGEGGSGSSGSTSSSSSASSSSSSGNAPDGSTSGGDGSGQPAPPRCDKNKAFGPPELVAEFDGQQNTNRAKLSADELDAFWVIGNAGSRQLRQAHRDTLSSPWVVTNIATNPGIGGLTSVTVNGLKIYYVADTTQQFTVATRTDRRGAFTNGKTIMRDAAGFFGTFVVESDDWAYYDRIKNGTVEIQLLKAPLLVSGIASNIAEPVPNLDRPSSDDWDPVLSPDQLTIFFMSGPDSPTVQQWMARRTSTQVNFGPPMRVQELEDTANDHVSWVSNDECVVYLTRSAHIYTAKRAL
jgi:hypothetical protein